MLPEFLKEGAYIFFSGKQQIGPGKYLSINLPLRGNKIYFLKNNSNDFVS